MPKCLTSKPIEEWIGSTFQVPVGSVTAAGAVCVAVLMVSAS
jgi:hypothetical protein